MFSVFTFILKQSKSNMSKAYQQLVLNNKLAIEKESKLNYFVNKTFKENVISTYSRLKNGSQKRGLMIDILNVFINIEQKSFNNRNLSYGMFRLKKFNAYLKHKSNT